jgi:hypothetical protein
VSSFFASQREGIFFKNKFGIESLTSKKMNQKKFVEWEWNDGLLLFQTTMEPNYQTPSFVKLSLRSVATSSLYMRFPLCNAFFSLQSIFEVITLFGQKKL